jgi:hypothetical protein
MEEEQAWTAMRLLGLPLSLAVVLGWCSGCQSPKPHLSRDSVLQRLNTAYSLIDAGKLESADSIYQDLLTFSVSAVDSVSISGTYARLLLQKGDTSLALVHLDRAFPLTDLNPRNLMRRHSFRFEVFLAKHECASAQSELSSMFDLVERDSTLQLSKVDLQHNQQILRNKCPAPASVPGPNAR